MNPHSSSSLNNHPPRTLGRAVLFWRIWCRGFKGASSILNPLVKPITKASLSVRAESTNGTVVLGLYKGDKFLKNS